MKTSFRSKVMRQAHEIHKATGKTFSICLINAWNAYRLTKRMTKEVVKFAFEKIDGSLRYASGTLNGLGSDLIKGTGTPNFKTVSYFDIDAKGFRSFKVENLIRVY